MKRKILFAITKSNWGGAQKYVYELATGLPTDTYDVKVLFGEHGTLEKRLIEKNIPIIPIDCLMRDVNIFSDIKVFFFLVKTLLRERPDVFHVNSSKIGGLGALAGRIARVPHIVFTAHGWAFNENRSGFSRGLILFVHWITILLCHSVICVSEVTRRQISWLPGVQKKCIIVRNGIHMNPGEPREDAQHTIIEKCPDIKRDTLWIGTIAELHKNKGLDILIEAVVSMSEKIQKMISVVVIGLGEERDTLTALIKKHHLEKKIFLVGAIPDAGRVLSAFDIFTLPSRTEAFPYTILEAGLASLPIVASRVGGIPEVIKNEKNGLLIPKENVAELQKALIRLIENPSLRATYGKAHADIITSEYSFEKMLEKTESVYLT